MKQILMLSYNRIGRGTYWRAWGFAKELVKRNYQVTLLVVSDSRRNGFHEIKREGISVIETPDLFPKTGYDPWDVANRIKWVIPRQFDVIHSFETRPVNLFPALIAHWQKKGIWITDWCDWFGRGGSVEQRPAYVRMVLSPLETFFENAFRKLPKGTTVINRILRQRAEQLGVRPDSILMLPNGANVNEIRPLDKILVRTSLGLPIQVPIIAYTGAMFSSDAQLMVESFNRLQKQIPSTKLLIIGYNNLNIKSLVTDSDAVITTGPVSYEMLAQYVAASDLGWLPLKNTGANQGRFPMKVHDFLSAGRPLVVTNVGDLGDFVKQESVGWVADDTPESITQVTCQALSNSEKRQQLGHHARIVAETKYAWPNVTNKLELFYKSFENNDGK